MRPILILVLIISVCGCIDASEAAAPLREHPSALKARSVKPTPPPAPAPPPSGTTGAVTVIAPLQGPHGPGLTQPVMVLTRQLCGSYKVEFGDGTSMTGTLSGTNATANVHHTYEKSGPMKLIATGTGSCTGQATQTVTIPAPGEVTSVVATPVPAMVHLNQQIKVETQGTCSQIAVDFGDGANSTADGPGTAETGGKYFVQFTHAYAGAGLKTVKATGANCSGIAQTTVDVKAPMGNSANTPMASTQINPAIIPSFTLTSVGFYYPNSFEEMIETANNAILTVPVPSLSGPPILANDVFFNFKANNFPPEILQALSGSYNETTPQQDRSVTLELTSPNSRSGPDNMAWHSTVSVTGQTLTLTVQFDLRIAMQHAPYGVAFTVTYKGKTYKAKPATIKAGNPMGSFFKLALYPTFLSQRCQTCHSMGDQAAIVKQHTTQSATLSLPYPVDPDGGFANLPASQAQPDNTAGCNTCHNPQMSDVAEWETPSFTKSINWKTMTSWQEICYVVIAHLPTPQQRYNHFHNDARVKWAITSGKVPLGYKLPTAEPHNMAEFLAAVDAWNSLSQPCEE